jgi:ABC-type transport system involved in multi-copper enzyme maturation permease subunit
LFAGPIIAREVLTAPRPLRFYVSRASYAGLLFILMWTAWQALVGWREDIDVGLLSRFGGILMLVFSMTQLTLMLFFAPLAAATAVAHEKDRRTFVLLLMTDLSDLEIVLGKLIASLLQIVTLLAVAAPVLFLGLLLGGISPEQVVYILAMTAAAGLAGGSLGLVVALWRDRTFQSLALTVLVVVLAIAGVEAIAALWPEANIAGVPLRVSLNPFRAVRTVLQPDANALGLLGRTTIMFVLSSLGVSLLLNALAVVKLRVWNPGRNEPREQREGEEEVIVEQLIEVEEVRVEEAVAIGAGGSVASLTVSSSRTAVPAPNIPTSTPGDGEMSQTTGLHVPRRTHRRITRGPRTYRMPWRYPIIWRELKTRAYGRKPLIVKGAYFLAFALGVALFTFVSEGREDPLASGMSLVPIALAVLSLILINAQGVTSLTSERDTGALDLLLVTELTPKEFIYGKLYGVLYNAKEMVALPVLLSLWFWWRGILSGEGAFFVIVDFLLLCHFSAMLGIHAAITYTNSRTAVANSLGTIFFLMVGIGICAFLIILGNREFGRQLISFLIFIGAGSVALFGSLGAKNPSQAIALVALLTPFWSFYCIISLLNGDVMATFLVSVGVYGFALLAMLVPAVSDFDIALGRTSAIQG